MTEKPRSLAATFGIVLFVLAGSQAIAAELVMFERDGCTWCQRWNREVGKVYDQTPESRRLPLRRINITRQDVGNALREPVVYTPTFVVVDGGKEVGRITGYVNDDTFWGLLGSLLDRLPSAAPGD
jgi:thioredoxin-related protein